MSETNVTENVTVEMFNELTRRVTELETLLTKANEKSQKEMTDEHARNILNGECKDLKHNEAAQKLGLSYGQIYSCRGEYTFRHIHKELQSKGWVNPWKKK